MYKGHTDKAKVGRFEGGRHRWVGWRGMVGRKWRQLYLNNNRKNFKKEIYVGKEREKVSKKNIYQIFFFFSFTLNSINIY